MSIELLPLERPHRIDATALPRASRARQCSRDVFVLMLVYHVRP